MVKNGTKSSLKKDQNIMNKIFILTYKNKILGIFEIISEAIIAREHLIKSSSKYLEKIFEIKEYNIGKLYE